MARPLVIVYQELAQATAVPTTPDLNTVLLGPAYDILDYPDDASTILLTQTYGTADGAAGGASPYVPPTAGTDAVIVTTYPGASPGSYIKHSSVKVTFRLPRVVLGSTNPGVLPILGTGMTTTSLDRTRISLAGPAINFVTAGIRAGDRIVLTSSGIGCAPGVVQSVVRTVASVGEPNSQGLVPPGNEGLLRISQNLPDPGVLANQWIYDNLVPGAGEFRIERVLSSQEFIDVTHTFITFPDPGSDRMVLKGGIVLIIPLTPVPTVAVPAPTTTNVTRTLSYSEIYLGYCGLRQDLQGVYQATNSSITTINGISYVTGIGKIDARDPLAVGIFIALQNSGSAPIYYFGVQSNDTAGHMAARAEINNRRDLYCLVPLTSDTNVLAGYKSECEQMADPTYALTNGIPQTFRVVIGSTDLPTAATVFEGTFNAEANPKASTTTGKYRKISIATGSSVGVTQVLPGDSVVIGLVRTGAPGFTDWQGRRGTHYVSHVLQNYVGGTPSIFQVEPATSRWLDTAGAAGSDIELQVFAPDGTRKLSKLAQVDIETDHGVGTEGHVLWSMLVPTTQGGPYTVTYVSSGVANHVVAFSLVGFTLTVTMGTLTTHHDVSEALKAHATLSLIMDTTEGVGAAQVVNPAAPFVPFPTSIDPPSASCTAEVLVNTDLYLQLDDPSALLLTAGIHPGDTLEIPIDPNDYTTAAFSGTVFSYTVDQVVNENRLYIVNHGDDSAAVANELPHAYNRLLAGRLIDNTYPNAQRYRVRRLLTKDEQVMVLTSQAASFRHKRVTIVWPDLATVSGLKDGSLVRSDPTVPSLAGPQPGWTIACQVGGALAGLPVQHGLTNLGLAGISRIYHSSGYFSEAQLSRLSDGGLFVMQQRLPTDLPSCVHQLTTDITALETGELSVVKNVDFLSVFYQGILEGFLGQYNVLSETQNEIFRAMDAGTESLKMRKVARIGPPLIDGEVTQIKVSDYAADRYVIYFTGSVPKPVNGIDLHIVV